MQKNIWIWGKHAVFNALKKRAKFVQKIFLSTQMEKQIVIECQKHSIDLNKISQKAFIEIIPKIKMDQQFGPQHQGIAIQIEQIKFWNLNEWIETQGHISTLIACDIIEDPHNLGAIIRTAAAFKANGVLVTKDKQAPFEGTLAKSACGGIEFINIVQVVNLATALDVLKKENYIIYGLDENGSKNWPEKDKNNNISNRNLTNRNVIILGQEQNGLRALTKKRCDFIISIPTSPEFPTLNVSVSAGIALAHFCK